MASSSSTITPSSKLDTRSAFFDAVGKLKKAREDSRAFQMRVFSGLAKSDDPEGNECHMKEKLAMALVYVTFFMYQAGLAGNGEISNKAELLYSKIQDSKDASLIGETLALIGDEFESVMKACEKDTLKRRDKVDQFWNVLNSN